MNNINIIRTNKTYKYLKEINIELYKGFNFDEFWDDNDCSIEEYI